MAGWAAVPSKLREVGSREQPGEALSGRTQRFARALTVGRTGADENYNARF
jgi:hypothetical protein